MACPQLATHLEPAPTGPLTRPATQHAAAQLERRRHSPTHSAPNTPQPHLLRHEKHANTPRPWPTLSASSPRPDAARTAATAPLLASLLVPCGRARESATSSCAGGACEGGVPGGTSACAVVAPMYGSDGSTMPSRCGGASCKHSSSSVHAGAHSARAYSRADLVRLVVMKRSLHSCGSAAHSASMLKSVAPKSQAPLGRRPRTLSQLARPAWPTTAPPSARATRQRRQVTRVSATLLRYRRHRCVRL